MEKNSVSVLYSLVEKTPEPQIDAVARPTIGEAPVVGTPQPCMNHLASLSLSENGAKSTYLLTFLEPNESE